MKPAAGHRPLAYSSPEAVQTPGTVAEVVVAKVRVLGNLAPAKPSAQPFD